MLENEDVEIIEPPPKPPPEFCDLTLTRDDDEYEGSTKQHKIEHSVKGALGVPNRKPANTRSAAEQLKLSGKQPTMDQAIQTGGRIILIQKPPKGQVPIYGGTLASQHQPQGQSVILGGTLSSQNQHQSQQTFLGGQGGTMTVQHQTGGTLISQHGVQGHLVIPGGTVTLQQLQGSQIINQDQTRLQPQPSSGNAASSTFVPIPNLSQFGTNALSTNNQKAQDTLRTTTRTTQQTLPLQAIPTLNSEIGSTSAPHINVNLASSQTTTTQQTLPLQASRIPPSSSQIRSQSASETNMNLVPSQTTSTQQTMPVHAARIPAPNCQIISTSAPRTNVSQGQLQTTRTMQQTLLLLAIPTPNSQIVSTSSPRTNVSPGSSQTTIRLRKLLPSQATTIPPSSSQIGSPSAPQTNVNLAPSQTTLTQQTMPPHAARIPAPNCQIISTSDVSQGQLQAIRTMQQTLPLQASGIPPSSAQVASTSAPLTRVSQVPTQTTRATQQTLPLQVSRIPASNSQIASTSAPGTNVSQGQLQTTNTMQQTLLLQAIPTPNSQIVSSSAPGTNVSQASKTTTRVQQPLPSQATRIPTPSISSPQTNVSLGSSQSATRVQQPLLSQATRIPTPSISSPRTNVSQVPSQTTEHIKHCRNKLQNSLHRALKLEAHTQKIVQVSQQTSNAALAPNKLPEDGSSSVVTGSNNGVQQHADEQTSMAASTAPGNSKQNTATASAATPGKPNLVALPQDDIRYEKSGYKTQIGLEMPKRKRKHSDTQESTDTFDDRNQRYQSDRSPVKLSPLTKTKVILRTTSKHSDTAEKLDESSSKLSPSSNREVVPKRNHRFSETQESSGTQDDTNGTDKSDKSFSKQSPSTNGEVIINRNCKHSDTCDTHNATGKSDGSFNEQSTSTRTEDKVNAKNGSDEPMEGASKTGESQDKKSTCEADQKEPAMRKDGTSEANKDGDKDQKTPPEEQPNRDPNRKGDNFKMDSVTQVTCVVCNLSGPEENLHRISYDRNKADEPSLAERLSKIIKIDDLYGSDRGVSYRLFLCASCLDDVVQVERLKMKIKSGFNRKLGLRNSTSNEHSRMKKSDSSKVGDNDDCQSTSSSSSTFSSMVFNLKQSVDDIFKQTASRIASAWQEASSSIPISTAQHDHSHIPSTTQHDHGHNKPSHTQQHDHGGSTPMSTAQPTHGLFRPSSTPQPAHGLFRPSSTPQPAHGLFRPSSTAQPAHALFRPSSTPQPVHGLFRPSSSVYYHSTGICTTQPDHGLSYEEVRWQNIQGIYGQKSVTFVIQVLKKKAGKRPGNKTKMSRKQLKDNKGKCSPGKSTKELDPGASTSTGMLSKVSTSKLHGKKGSTGKKKIKKGNKVESPVIQGVGMDIYIRDVRQAQERVKKKEKKKGKKERKKKGVKDNTNLGKKKKKKKEKKDK